MAKEIKLIIRSNINGGVDAPTPEDLLGQVKDFVDILRGVERAFGEGVVASVDWRITKATTNSPITFEITPFPVNPAMNITARVLEIEKAASNGLKDMARGVERPKYFTDDVLARAEQMHSRVQNGLADTEIGFDAEVSPDAILIDRSAATLRDALRAQKKDQVQTYQELGSIEGHIVTVERDGRGTSVLIIRDRRTRKLVKATPKGAAFAALDTVSLGEVWRGLRVRARGVITYSSIGVIKAFKVNGLNIVKDEGLPTMHDIVDPDFTDGLPTEDYLEQLRRG